MVFFMRVGSTIFTSSKALDDLLFESSSISLKEVLDSLVIRTFTLLMTAILIVAFVFKAGKLVFKRLAALIQRKCNDLSNVGCKSTIKISNDTEQTFIDKNTVSRSDEKQTTEEVGLEGESNDKNEMRAKLSPNSSGFPFTTLNELPRQNKSHTPNATKTISKSGQAPVALVSFDTHESCHCPLPKLTLPVCTAVQGKNDCVTNSTQTIFGAFRKLPALKPRTKFNKSTQTRLGSDRRKEAQKNKCNKKASSMPNLATCLEVNEEFSENKGKPDGRHSVLETRNDVSRKGRAANPAVEDWLRECNSRIEDLSNQQEYQLKKGIGIASPHKSITSKVTPPSNMERSLSKLPQTKISKKKRQL